MKEILHTNLKVNGINMHIASIGDKNSSPILFLHGFPELWYSWRHQMLHLSTKGYHCIAPDLRGFGDTDSPQGVENYTTFHIVGDLVALLDVLGLEKVFLVGHDWGAFIGWWFCLFRPDRIKALVNISVPYMPRNPEVKTVQGLRAQFGDGLYICRFQEPGKAEAEFATVETTSIIKALLCLRKPEPPIIPIEESMSEKFKPPVELPSWLTEQDINYYASKFDQTGFTGGLNYYRAMDLTWELTAAWTGSEINVPTKFILGDLDLPYGVPEMKDYIHNGGFKKFVPSLEEVVVFEGVAHFLNQEKPDELNQHIFNFFNKF